MTRIEYNRIEATLEILDRALEVMESGRISQGLEDIRTAALLVRVMQKSGEKKYAEQSS